MKALRQLPAQHDLPIQLPMRLLDDALDGAIIIDCASRICYVNHAMEALCGFRRTELLGQSLDTLVPSDGSAAHSRKVADFIASGRASTVLGHVREFEIMHHSGELRPVELKAIDLGALGGMRYFGAFLTDIRTRKDMEARNAKLLAMLEQQAMTDPLTSLPNRRAFQREAGAAAPVTVGVADIDHFKAINDSYGHAAGDAVLCAVASAICAVARDTDVVARLGGEEFGLIFPNTSLDQAGQIAERIRSAIAAVKIPLKNAGAVEVTISIGLACMNGRHNLVDALERADAALYAAKDNGRNRVELHEHT